MQVVFQGKSFDTTSVSFSRGSSDTIKGVFKYVKTGTGTCTLELKDGYTDAVLSSLAVGAGNPVSAEESVFLGNTHYAEISSSAGVFSINVFVDGGIGSRTSGITEFDFTKTLPGDVTFARSGSAWMFEEGGKLVEIGDGFPRVGAHYYNGTTWVNGGILIEQGEANSALHSRDFTNAVWTKSNVTAAKDVIGLDYELNSASTLVATAADGTVFQTVTLGSAERTSSFWIKRISGSGTIEISDNNGTNYTDVTSSINSNEFTPVSVTRTQANPVFGIRLGTSGDKIAVDAGQVETSRSRTSPIITTSGAVTRNSDVVTINPVTFWNDNECVIFIDTFKEEDSSTSARLLVFSDGTDAERIQFEQTSDNLNVFASIISSSINTLGFSSAARAVVYPEAFSFALRFDPGGAQVAKDGSATIEDLAIVLPSGIDQADIGRTRGSSANMWNGFVKTIRHYHEDQTEGFIEDIT